MASTDVIKEGYLFKRGRILSLWMRRWFQVRPNCVVKYSDEPQDSTLKTLSITSTAVNAVEKVEMYGRYGFKLDIGGTAHQFFCDTPAERDAWIGALKTSSSPGSPAMKKTQTQPNPPAQAASPAAAYPAGTRSAPAPGTVPAVPKGTGSVPPSGNQSVAPNLAAGPVIKAIRGIDDTYAIGATLGSGGFATVKVGTEKSTGQQFAVKVMKRAVVDKNKDAIYLEIKIMQVLDHPNLVRIHEVLETPAELFLIMEYLKGEELFQSIVSKGSYSERDTATVLYQIVSALSYLHGKGISHCDLKPENLVYAKDKDAEVKIIDFGLSTFVNSEAGKKTKMLQGTPEYIAPETIRGHGYPCSVDMWAVGVIMYILLCGYYPIYGKDMKKIFAKTLRGEYEFPAAEWSKVSDSAKNLIKHLLVVDPAQRYTAKDCLQDPWLKGVAAPSTALPMATVVNLKRFNARRKFKAVQAGVRAIGRMQILQRNASLGSISDGVDRLNLRSS